VALENYTKKQKIMLAALTIVGAALFTVTGTMMHVVQGCGEDKAGTGKSQGSFDGVEVDRELFRYRARVMEMLSPVVPLFAESGNEHMLINYGAPGNTTATQQGVRLYSLWPKKHDQHVWLFAALVDRAKQAGFTQLPPASASEWYFSRVGEGKYNTEAERRKHFEETNTDAAIFTRALSEGLMVQNYVAALVSRHDADYDDMLRLFAYRFVQRKADIYSLDVDKFMAEAGAMVKRDRDLSKLASIASALSGGGGMIPATDPLERLSDKPSFSEGEQLKQRQELSFDAVVASYDDIQKQLEAGGTPELKARVEDEKQSYYLNMRGNTFRVKADDATDTRIDERFKAVAAKYEGKADERAEWEKKTRADMKLYYDYSEVQGEIAAQVYRQLAEQFARSAINIVDEGFTKTRTELEKKLKAAAATLAEKKKIPDARQTQIKDIESRLKSFPEYPLSEMFNTLDRNKSISEDRAGAENLYNQLAQAITRNVGQSAAGQAVSLRTIIDLEQMRRTIRDKENELADILALQKEKAPADDDYDALERPAQARFAVDAAKAKLDEATKLKAKIDAFCDKVLAWCAAIDLRATGMKEDDHGVTLLKGLINELVLSYPQFIDDASKGIVEQSRLDELDADVAAAQREVDRANTKANRDSKVLREVNFANVAKNVAVGRGITIDLRRDAGIPEESPAAMDKLATDKDWFWLDKVSAAKSYLANTDNPAGSVSQVLSRPGYGFYLLRMFVNREQIDLSPKEKPDAALKLAIAAKARDLAKAEMTRIRAAANASGDAAAYLAKLAADKTIRGPRATGYFDWQGGVAEVRCAPDPDSTGASGLNESKPCDPFFTALKPIGPGSPVGAAFLEYAEGSSTDADAKYAYSIAMITATRHDGTAVPLSKYDLRGAGLDSTVLNMKLASDPDVAVLLNPAELLKGHDVKYKPDDYKEREKKKADDSQDDGKSK
jgi:hypothetical protein